MTDPSEKTPLPLSPEMEKKLTDWIKRHPTAVPEQGELSERIREELSAIGYLTHGN